MPNPTTIAVVEQSNFSREKARELFDTLGAQASAELVAFRSTKCGACRSFLDARIADYLGLRKDYPQRFGTDTAAAFAHVKYPQQLRVLLGIAKLLGGITLIVHGLFTLTEWAYAGFTFAWVAAVVAHYLAKGGAIAFFPPILLVLLFVSYFTRPASRRLGSKAAA